MNAVAPQGVLVLDEEALMRWPLRCLLEAEGHAVLEAGTLGEACRLLDDSAPWAAVADVDLPDGHGLEVVRALVGRLPGPLIVLTLSDEVTSDELLAAGATTVWRKPAPLRELVAALASLGAQERSARPATSSDPRAP